MLKLIFDLKSFFKYKKKKYYIFYYIYFFIFILFFFYIKFIICMIIYFDITKLKISTSKNKHPLIADWSIGFQWNFLPLHVKNPDFNADDVKFHGIFCHYMLKFRFYCINLYKNK